MLVEFFSLHCHHLEAVVGERLMAVVRRQQRHGPSNAKFQSSCLNLACGDNREFIIWKIDFNKKIKIILSLLNYL